MLFAAAWLGCLPSYRQVDAGTQITLMVSLAGLIYYWHARWIPAVTTPSETVASLSHRIGQTLDSMPEGLIVTDRYNRIVMANETLLSSIGLSSEQVIGRRPDSFPWVISTLNGAKDFPWNQTRETSQAKPEQLLCYRIPRGSERFFSVNASPVVGQDNVHQGAIITLRDVTEVETHRAEIQRKLVRLRFSRDEVQSQNRELQVLATQDPLTECLNRRSFFQNFQILWQHSVVSGTELSCLMIDVDHFKQVNDGYGHPVGDEVLKEISRVLRQHFVAPALVSRYGGEEFCVVVPQTSIEQTTAMAEQVRHQIEAIRVTSEPNLRLSASFGVSSVTQGIERMEDLVRQADECLYHAKTTGRNRVVNRHHYVASIESVL